MLRTSDRAAAEMQPLAIMLAYGRIMSVHLLSMTCSASREWIFFLLNADRCTQRKRLCICALRLCCKRSLNFNL